MNPIAHFAAIFAAITAAYYLIAAMSDHRFASMVLATACGVKVAALLDDFSAWLAQ